MVELNRLKVRVAALLFWLGRMTALTLCVSTFGGSARKKMPYFYLGLMMSWKLWVVYNGFRASI